ncbi:MAG: DUF2971 domain-containing protein [Eubacteriales bacterium]|nr:DUF2971 domain-containing protein [Eubacteriales bacterium]
MEDQIPEILYHYCSIDTFVKIVQNKTLRLSEIAKSNDSMECRWLEKVVIPKMLEAELDELYKKKAEQQIEVPDKKYISKINQVLATRRLDYYFEGDIGYIENKLVLATCFSEKRDLLSQWRGYANDGYGVAIGFRSRMFNDITYSFDMPIDLKKVLYNRNDQEKEVQQFVQECAKGFLNEDETDKERVIRDLVVKSLTPSVYIKNPAFTEEAEWRFFTALGLIRDYSEFLEEINSFEITGLLSNLGVITRGDRAVFFCDINLESVSKRINERNVEYIYRGARNGNCNSTL